MTESLDVEVHMAKTGVRMNWLLVGQEEKIRESQLIIVDLWSADTTLARNPSVVSDAPHSQCVQVDPVLRGASDTTV